MVKEELLKENKDLKSLLNVYLAKEQRRRIYMRNYMRKARKEGRIKHWREYLREKKETLLRKISSKLVSEEKISEELAINSAKEGFEEVERLLLNHTEAV